MSVPKPPFHSAMEELLYNIYLKLDNTSMPSFSASDIDTLAKLNAILTDADLMKVEDIQNAINALKGNVPAEGDTLEKLFGIIQALNYLKAEDIDTLAELNAILIDADIIKTEELASAIDDLKGNAPPSGNTLGKLYNLLAPVLSAFVLGGNTVGSVLALGTKDNFALPFITNNVERARIDEAGRFLLGFTGVGVGKLHIRTGDALETSYAAYIQNSALTILCALTNSGKLFLNKDRSNLLVNGGWPAMSSQRNLIVTSGINGGKLVDTGSDNVILGYDTASTGGSNPTRSIQRNVVIGSEAGSTDNNGSSYLDSVFIGYRAARVVGNISGQRCTMIGANAGGAAAQSGNDHTVIGYDAQTSRPNSFNTLIGSGTRAYNNNGDLSSNSGGLTYMTAIGAGAVVRTANTIVLGRAVTEKIVIGAERNNLQLPGVTLNTGFNGYKLQVISSGTLGLGISGSSLFRDGNFSINLGEDGSATVKNTFRINSYVGGLGGYDFILSANNTNAVLEITDHLIGGTVNEMIRITGNSHPGAYIRMEEIIGAMGPFIEAYKFDAGSNAMKLKFAVDKDGVVTMAQTNYNPDGIDGTCRLYFRSDELRFITPTGEVRTVFTDFAST